MAFRLKDKELQKKLDEISDGDFSKQMKVHSDLGLFDGKVDRYLITFGKTKTSFPRFEVIIERDELEQVSEYDKNAWNDFPTVTPPENVPMRIEVKRIGGKDHGSTFPFYGYFKDSEWIVLIRRSFNKLLKEFSDFDPTYDKIRFRPWND